MEIIKATVLPYFKRKEFPLEAVSLLFALSVGGIAPPFAAAAVIAVWMTPAQPFLALAGAVAGSLITGRIEGAITAALAVAVGLIISVWKRIGNGDKLIAMLVAQSLLLPLYHMKTPQAFLTGVVSMGAAVGAAAFIRRGICCVRLMREGKPAGRLNLWSIAVTAALFIASFAELSVLGVRIYAPLAAFFVLVSVRVKGTAAVAPAVLIGAACAILSSEGMAFGGCLAVCALIASITNERRWWTLALFIVPAVAAGLKLEGALTHIELALGAGLYIALPERYIERMKLCALPTEQARAQRELYAVEERLCAAADVLERLAALQAGSFISRQTAGIGRAIRKCVSGSEQEDSRLRYKVHFGAAACTKEGSADTGDCMSIREYGGITALILSDGMGTGAEAHSESATASAMLGDLLAVGFELTDALECVNRLLMNRDASDMYATLDAVLIDKLSGSARIVKYGAPPSYILRDGKLRTVYAETLPVGIVEEARPALHEINLRRGDFIVMLTDGALDGLGAELSDAVISAEKEKDENAAAGVLLESAKKNGRPDDMSVMVARIE